MRRAFTLIELLVVIAILAVLMGILLPALAMARRHAQSTVGNANLRSLTQVMLVYTNDNGEQFLNPFGLGRPIEDGDEMDFNDAASSTVENCGLRWNFNAEPLCPPCTTEMFAYYWYSYIAENDKGMRIREEQYSPADVSIRNLRGELGSRPETMEGLMLWPGSFLYSPTFWSKPERYPEDCPRLTTTVDMVRTNLVSNVSFPSAKVLMWERMDFGQKERILLDNEAAEREGRAPAWNNIRARTAVSVVDGSVEEIDMGRLYGAAEAEEIIPLDLGSMPDDPPLLRPEGSIDQPVGGSGRSDAPYPLVFWATRRGVEGRDLPR